MLLPVVLALDTCYFVLEPIFCDERTLHTNFSVRGLSLCEAATFLAGAIFGAGAPVWAGARFCPGATLLRWRSFFGRTPLWMEARSGVNCSWSNASAFSFISRVNPDFVMEQLFGL